MNRKLEILIWALVWIAGVLVIGFGAGETLPRVPAMVVAFVGGYAWGYFMARVLFDKILDW
jgi:hypothetical protein